ncbi:MAG TPA: Fic family protein [Longimicrobiales bacterium]|nr:Fic family protein [Longimicrobiales bacterium]
MTMSVPAKYRRACHFEAYVPDPLMDLALEVGLDLAGLIAEAESSIRALNQGARPALIPLARFLLKAESIASSKVEGLQLSVREIARAEARLDIGEGRVSNTALEIIGNIEAMELAIQDAADAREFTVGAIREIHERLMLKSPHPHLAGRIRTVQNWIGGNDYNPCGADFVPPPPEHVEGLLDDLCAAVNDDVLPPLVQAALVHAQFETIHPFEDGNGRTGRALIHVVLKRRGVATNYVPPISIMFANSRQRYIDGLTAFRGDGVRAWIEHFAASAYGAAALAQNYVDTVAEQGERWRSMLRDSHAHVRSDAAAWAIIDVLPMHPLITAPIAAAAVQRSKPQVYAAIEQLLVAGILTPAGRAGRAQVYEAAGMLDLITASETGEATEEPLR